MVFDDRCLKGYSLQTWHMERDLARSRGQSPVVVPASISLSRFVAFITRRLCKLLRFCFQRLVQCLFYASAHKFLDLPLDYSLIQCYNFLRDGSKVPFEYLCSNCILPTAGHVYFFAQFIVHYLTL